MASACVVASTACRTDCVCDDCHMSIVFRRIISKRSQSKEQRLRQTWTTQRCRSPKYMRARTRALSCITHSVFQNGHARMHSPTTPASHDWIGPKGALKIHPGGRQALSSRAIRTGAVEPRCGIRNGQAMVKSKASHSHTTHSTANQTVGHDTVSRHN